MIEKVRKRDGRVVPFDSEKIVDAIWKAARSVGGKDRTKAEHLGRIVINVLEGRFGNRTPNVEEVQDLVEKVLIEEGHAKTAKAYILYRKSHQDLREVKGIFDTIQVVEDYVGLNDWAIKENSNMGFSLQGLNNYIAEKIIKSYWLNRIYPEPIRKVHESADIHIHDLGTLGPYCVGWDLRDLLLQGFTGVSGKVQTKPAKRLRTALGHVVNFFYTLQGESAGAQAFSNFDTLLAPFVRYDKLDYSEVKQCFQEFCFNMAVPTRVGFQCMSEDTEILTPFGWKGYADLKKGEIIKTFNIEKEIIEDKPIKKLFAREYSGIMYNLKNKETDQLISPKHRVAYKLNSKDKYNLSPIEDIKNKSFFIPAAISKEDYSFEEFYSSEITKINEVSYKGIIWCPNTDNETVIARRNGKVFITGNTPFTNVTLDLKIPDYMKNEPVIIGGKFQKETYGDFQKEADMVNKAFAEVMLAGDAKGRLFTFPIPTYNITKDFDWDNPDYDGIWEMTAKYGIPYFSNFVNSDMKPEDARSMCPLAGDEKVLIKSSRGRNLEYGEIRNIFKSRRKEEEYEIYSDGKFVKGKFNQFGNQKMIKVVLENGHEIKMSTAHLNFVQDGKQELVIRGDKLNKSMYLPYSLNKYAGEGGSRELGFFVGAYAGDGSFDDETSVVFSLEGNFKKDIIPRLQKIAKDYFGAHSHVVNDKKSKLVTLKIHSGAAVGLCKDFVEGIKREKHYKARIFDMSVEFREGALEGHYATDGGNRNRIYTSSKKMVETLNMLAATLGTTTAIYKDEGDGRFGKEPNYSVLFYKLNRSKYGNIWFKKDKKLWVKIKDIVPIKNNSAYCFEVKDGEPIFTVGTTGILTHNCRLRLDQTELRKKGGGLFGANPLTGSVGVVTINMPRLGFTCATEKEFLDKLGELMDLSKESLEIKRKALESFTKNGLYPYSKFYLRNVYQRFGSYWKNHFSTIGLLGMNEAISNFMEGESIATPKGREFASRVLDFMREKLEKYQEESGHIYNLEATPGEGTTYRFARADKNRFGTIKVANESNISKGAKPYYTNSTHLPVGFTDDLFSALELQDPLQVKYNGGTVFHAFIGEKLEKDAVKLIVKKIADNFRLPYFTLTPTFSICPVHGYLAGEHEFCPVCDKIQEEQNLEVKNEN